jgi:gamma-glutamyltranspeptidase/glutathione hydrolase
VIACADLDVTKRQTLQQLMRHGGNSRRNVWHEQAAWRFADTASSGCMRLASTAPNRGRPIERRRNFMAIDRRTALTALTATTAMMGASSLGMARPAWSAAKRRVDLSPKTWPAGEYARYMKAQNVVRMSAGSARGKHGAVTVAYHGLAARAGLEALRQGGSAIDAAMTAALAQIALSAGSRISYFGIMSLVYFDAKTGKTHTMNAEWNTVTAETDPLSIPGELGLSSAEGRKGSGPPSGRTALVGGFMKGVEAAHRRFGKLPFASIFDPAIHIAEAGMPVTEVMAGIFGYRDKDLRRLPETRATLLKPDGTAYVEGDIFKQPKLAETLRRVAEDGADHMYRGQWAEKLIAAIQADGGRMTLDDLANYDVTWSDPLVGTLRHGYALHTSPPPNLGGVGMIEAQNLAEAAGLCDGEHWSKSSAQLRKALNITQIYGLNFIPGGAEASYSGMPFTHESRITKGHARKLWEQIHAGRLPTKWKQDPPRHSDDVVAIDREGNMAAITHTINCVNWGKTSIMVDGISIGDPAVFQKSAIAQAGPGARLPAPTETGILFKDGAPVLAFASMGSGLHERTFQGLLNVTAFGMSVEEAINAPDFYRPWNDPVTNETVIMVPEGRFDHNVLDGTGYAWREMPMAEAREGGEGKWVAISRDPDSGALHAASHNRNNSDALAF